MDASWDWRLFGIVALSSALVVIMGFEMVQHLAIKAGQIPPRGVHTWHGKPFLHWDHFTVQLVGDMVFLSLLNASVFMVVRQVAWQSWMTYVAIAIPVVALGVTIIWAKSVQNQFAEGKFNRWDWGFTFPSGTLSIAGRFHLAYFALETAFIGYALVLVFCTTSWFSRLALIIPIMGYAATAIYDAQKIGLSGGPFVGPKQFE